MKTCVLSTAKLAQELQSLVIYGLSEYSWGSLDRWHQTTKDALTLLLTQLTQDTRTLCK